MLIFLIPHPPFAGVSYSRWHCESFFGYTSPLCIRVFDTCQKYKTLQTAEMRAFLCQILFIFMLYGVVLYAIIRYEALVR